MHDRSSGTHASFWNTLEQHAERIAFLTEDGSSIDYTELARMADDAGFAALPRQLALIEMHNGADAIAAYVGALRAGHAVILTNAGNPESVEKLKQQFYPSLHWSAGHLVSHPESAGIELHDELSVMLSTSGSTGSAKLVRLSADAVDANARSIVEYLDMSPDDRAITSLPPAYSYGLSVINSHLLAGGALVLTDRSVIDPVFREIIDQHAVTSIACVPYTIDLLESSGYFSRIPGSLRTITQAGGRLAPEKVLRIGQFAEEANIRFYVMYGQTEATARMAWLPPHLRDTNPDCIGRAIPGGMLWLRDPETGEEHAERGELVYTGPNVMMGYAETPADLARGRDVIDLATGDLAERIEGDLFKIVGRQSRFVKIFGLRIALDEIEAQLRAKSVEAVVAGTDERVVVAIPGPIPQDAEAAAIAAQYKLPADRIAVVSVNKVPRLENGKVDYRTILGLAQPAAAGKSRNPYDDFEKLIKQLAGGKPVDPHASFDAMRSDSLSFVEASILLERAIGELPAEWQTVPFSTLKEMAKATAQQSGTPKVPFARDMLVRVAAISTIIVAHGLGIENRFLKGGADVMLMLAGYNVARYNSARLFSGSTLPVLLDPLRRIVPLLYFLLTLYTVIGHPLPYYYWTFTQNYYRDGKIPILWFLSSWIQCALFMTVLFSIPAVRRLFVRNVLNASIALLTVAVILKFVAFDWSDPASLRFHAFEQILCIFVTGWCFFFVQRKQDYLPFIVAATAVSALSWGIINTHPWMMAAALGFMAYGPKVRLPIAVAKPLQIVTLASLQIYMMGIIPAWALWKYGHTTGVKHYALTGLHFVVTLGLGIATWWTLRLIADRWHAVHGKWRIQRLAGGAAAA